MSDLVRRRPGRHEDEVARVSGGSLGGLGVMLPIGAVHLIGVGATVGARLAGALPAEPLPGTVGEIALPGVILVALGRWAIRTASEAARLPREGIEATEEILGIDGTGTKINGVPLVAVRPRVHAPNRAPFKAQARVLRSGLAGAEVGRLRGRSGGRRCTKGRVLCSRRGRAQRDAGRLRNAREGRSAKRCCPPPMRSSLVQS